MTHTKDEVLAAQGLVEAILRFAAAVEAGLSVHLEMCRWEEFRLIRQGSLP